MEQRNSSLAILREPFIAGMDKKLSSIMHRLWKLEGGSRQDEIFKNFIALVHENCISRREVTFYANRLRISTKCLTGICKSVTRDSAKKIIDDFAILEIKVLLQSTELTIQEIADRLGFPDQSYLGRYFKRHEGMSPKEYQNRYSM